MSGHSKWSKVKHQKATTDVARAQAFTKAMRGLYVAVSKGGGITDPEKNVHLRFAIEKARYANVPNDTIDRALAKATGEGSTSIQPVIYEGYGPGGVAFLIEAVTDNRARTVSVVKNLFDRHGGSLTVPGAVSYLFTRKGIVLVPKGPTPPDVILEHALNGGADDVVEKDDVFEIYSSPSALDPMKEHLEKNGISVDTAQLIMKPSVTIVPTEDNKRSLARLIEELEALDDVHDVYTNISEEV